MKLKIFRPTKGSLCLLTGLAAANFSLADAQLNPNQLVGAVRFTNQNPIIQSVLGEQGIGAVYMRADSIGLSPVLNNTMNLYLDGGSEFNYQMTVESSVAGIQYAVSADMRLDNRSERYLVEAQTTAPVYPEPVTDTHADISQCAALADIRFKNKQGQAVAVSGGYMHA